MSNDETGHVSHELSCIKHLFRTNFLSKVHTIIPKIMFTTNYTVSTSCTFLKFSFANRVFDFKQFNVRTNIVSRIFICGNVCLFIYFAAVIMQSKAIIIKNEFSVYIWTKSSTNLFHGWKFCKTFVNIYRRHSIWFN